MLKRGHCYIFQAQCKNTVLRGTGWEVYTTSRDESEVSHRQTDSDPLGACTESLRVTQHNSASGYTAGRPLIFIPWCNAVQHELNLSPNILTFLPATSVWDLKSEVITSGWLDLTQRLTRFKVEQALSTVRFINVKCSYGSLMDAM